MSNYNFGNVDIEFNTNKILDFTYDSSLSKVKPNVSYESGKDITILTAYGVKLKFTGILKEKPEILFNRFNTKLSEHLLTLGDNNLKYNFVYYYIN